MTDDELQMFKTRTKADLIRGLASNEGLAEQLAYYQTRYGDWRELFRYLDRVDKVTKADIRRVANQVFQDNNRTIGVIETQTASSHPGAPPPAKERNSNERQREPDLRRCDFEGACLQARRYRSLDFVITRRLWSPRDLLFSPRIYGLSHRPVLSSIARDRAGLRPATHALEQNPGAAACRLSPRRSPRAFSWRTAW